MQETSERSKIFTFKLAKIIARLLMVGDLVFIGVMVYFLSQSRSFQTIVTLIAAGCVVVLLIVASNIFAAKEFAYTEKQAQIALKIQYEEEREKERKEREANPPTFDLDKMLEELHPDVKNLVITNRNISDYIPKLESMHSYIGIEPSLIDEYLPVNINIDPAKEFVRKLGAGLSGLSYSQISPNQRGMYLKFLKEPYDETVDPGYVMIFFFGLERQLVHGEGGAAADVIIQLRQVHHAPHFRTLSFNALLYFCKSDNSALFEFLRRNYYDLNVDLTIYYHLCTDKILPSEVMVRFRKYFDFPSDSTEINPALFKSELDRIFSDDTPFSNKNIQTGYSLEKYMKSYGKPQMESLPFPANRSMDKLVRDQRNLKHLYEVQPYKGEISDALSRAYLNAIKNNIPYGFGKTGF